jgi:hypothetical protein
MVELIMNNKPNGWQCDLGNGEWDHDWIERHDSSGEVDGGPGEHWSWRECRVCGAREDGVKATTKWQFKSNGLNFIIFDPGDDFRTVAECRREEDARLICDMRNDALTTVDRMKAYADTMTEEFKFALRYVSHHRLPLGNTVIETLPEHWQEKVHKLL